MSPNNEAVTSEFASRDYFSRIEDLCARNNIIQRKRTNAMVQMFYSYRQGKINSGSSENNLENSCRALS